jgi:hypothetical protein
MNAALTAVRPRATIIIEWENIQLAEAARCFTMLDVLAQQISEFHSWTTDGANNFEVLLLYNSEQCDGEEIRRSVEPRFEAIRSFCTLTLCAAAGTTYYEQKNTGALHATAEIIVYLDSDVIPEPGWLSALLTPLNDPEVQVVAGNSYLAASDVYSKAFALFWFFPQRATKAVFEKRNTFFANNVAFRRDVIQRFLFIAVPGATRGACRYLAHRLRQAGIPIHYNSTAQVNHPAPHGLRHFLIRALAQGRDRVFVNRILGRSVLRSLLKDILQPFRSAWRVLKNYRGVGLSLSELPMAITVAFVFNSLVIAGELLTRIAPKYTKELWQI